MNLSKYRSVVFILATGGLLTLVMIILATQSGRAAGPWYVAPDGDDGNDCVSTGTPCATINAAIAKASSGDTIYVAIGTYTSNDDEVVLLDKDLTLSGGWDAGFTTQSGTSTVDGGNAHRGITVNSGVTANVKRFAIQKGAASSGGGIHNEGNLILNNSIVCGNTASGSYGGGGIINYYGTLALNNSTVSGNTANYVGTPQRGGGGINNYHGTLTLNNSTISGNSANNGGGIYSLSGGTLTLNNSTISGNTAWQGGGIYSSGGGTLTLNNSTISGNSAPHGGGININVGTATLRNSILAENAGSDCLGTIGSSGYNLIGNISGCTFTPGTGDLTGVSANLGPLLGSPGYHPLLSGSPAIDAVPLGQCIIATDQRGVARPQGPACDMGAYEYTIPGPAASVSTFGGTPQRAAPFSNFGMPLQAAVLDSIGTPVSNTLVTFSAPGGGASGTFMDSGTFTTTAVTDESGVAMAATFTANGSRGSYTVTATISGVATPANFLLNNIAWHVAPGGSDSNDCLAPTTACATINGALNKPGFVSRDTILVTTGTYIGTGSEVVLLDRSATLSGGWDTSFAAQSGTSTIDGGGSRRGITVNSGVTAAVENFIVYKGSTDYGGGILNDGTLTLKASTVSGNTATDDGGGIYNEFDGTLTLNSSTVSGNTANRKGGGIYMWGGTATLNNCTVSGNSASDEGGGIYGRGTLTLNNSTVSGNTAYNGGGMIGAFGTVSLQNTILSGNSASRAGPDCSGTVGSSGYNLVGNTSGCAFTPGTDDLTNTDAKLGRLEGLPGYHPLLPDSPAINAGDPAGCMGSTGLLTTDQRGYPRFGNCDIGAYEMQPIGFSTKTVNRSIALPGDALTYTIALNNGGDTNLTSVRVTDTLPVSLTYQIGSLSATSGSYGYSNGVITWTGSVNAVEAEAVAYGATVDQGVHLGSSIVNHAVISSGEEVLRRSAYLEIRYDYVYFPCLARNYCPDFFDGFSNPASGWEVVDDSFALAHYLDGEYRILTRQAGYFYLFRAPACDRQKYVVEVDARWVGTPGSSYGLIFGLTRDFSRYYLFDMNTDYRMFRLMRRDPDGFRVVVPITDAPAIHGGTASNHLRVVRNGDQITLEVNGTVLGTWSDGTIGGWTGAGLVSSPYYDTPTSDARFDNFSMVSLPGDGVSARGPGGEMGEEGGLAAPNARRVPTPIDMGW